MGCVEPRWARWEHVEGPCSRTEESDHGSFDFEVRFASETSFCAHDDSEIILRSGLRGSYRACTDLRDFHEANSSSRSFDRLHQCHDHLFQGNQSQAQSAFAGGW